MADLLKVLWLSGIAIPSVKGTPTREIVQATGGVAGALRLIVMREANGVLATAAEKADNRPRRVSPRMAGRQAASCGDWVF